MSDIDIDTLLNDPEVRHMVGRLLAYSLDKTRKPYGYTELVFRNDPPSSDIIVMYGVNGHMKSSYDYSQPVESTVARPGKAPALLRVV